MSHRKAVIIGAGPAGLTAAYELLRQTDIKPIVYEMTDDIGGISRTACYKGNRMDIGGHRFFSKSDRVMQWWKDMLPLQGAPSWDDRILGREVPVSHEPDAPDPDKEDEVMLVRSRLSRIYFLRRFFNYPISLNVKTFQNLGLARIFKIGFSYLRVRVAPIRNERSLEDFLINRFGRELYETFFKYYTEKVWGVPCDQISPEWGAQRIKGLSISKAMLQAMKSTVARDRSIEQKNTETTLIEQFLYPKLGPGQMWHEVARKVEDMGGEIHLRHQVVGLRPSAGEKISGVDVQGLDNGEISTVQADYVFSTMPVRELIAAMDDHVPDQVANVAKGLMYRDFITVGLLLAKLKLPNESGQQTVHNSVPDNWIYVQERNVRLGRLQIFNNWSPYMVQDGNKIWIGLEYFCNEGDDLWTMQDDDLARFAAAELAEIEVIDQEDVLDWTVLRVPKCYPAYFGTYDRFDVIRDYVDQYANLFLIGRNGMHKYNNQDHSMLAAMEAVDNIVHDRRTKDNIWAVNAEEEYHEQK